MKVHPVGGLQSPATLGQRVARTPCAAYLNGDASLARWYPSMSWWKRILTGEDEAVAPRRLDYLNEGLALERQGDFEGAVTSYQLALRDQPHNVKILQYIAIALSKTGRIEEAIRHYRRALELEPELAGAHYGLAYLLLKRGDQERAASHLRAFLAKPPRDAEMARWVSHARETLNRLEAAPMAEPAEG